MKNLNTTILAFLVVFALIIVSCQQAPKEENTVLVKGVISEDTTWNSKTNYILNGPVIVTENATLTIEAGTVIKANPGEGQNVSMLVVARGGKLMAVGTPEHPIVFTSINDNLNNDDTAPSVLNDRDTGLWGGIILLGNAPISLENEDEETFYVGLNPGSSSSYYGGSDIDDSSGTLSYVSIRHGGIFIGTGSESNGLTLCGVGAKTMINNIEIYANQDDGLEIFGGTVNVSDLIVHASGDDALDIDQGYTGTVSNFILELTDTSESALEISGGQGSNPGLFKLVNGVIDGANLTNIEAYAIDSNAQGIISNLKEINLSKTVIRNNLSENVTIELSTETENSASDYSWTRTKRKE